MVPSAALAGVRALQDGGTAMDAAVTAAAVSNVAMTKTLTSAVASTRVGLFLHNEASIADYYYGNVLEGVRQAAQFRLRPAKPGWWNICNVLRADIRIPQMGIDLFLENPLAQRKKAFGLDRQE